MNETLKQVRAVRQDIGRFDRSDMGLLAITGPDRYAWLQGMVSNDVRLLQTGEAKRLQACILDPTGHVLADITLIDVPEGSHTARNVLGEGFILLETSPDDAERVGSLLERYLILEEAAVVPLSGRLRCTSVQGPNLDILRETLDACAATALVVHADHTGSGGYDVYELPPGSEAARLFSKAAEMPSSQERGSTDAVTHEDGGCWNDLARLAPTEVGAAAREILRIEAGIPKYGVDMDESTLAPEAGIVPTHISLTKGCYVGQEIVARIDSRGHTNRALTGLLVMGETLPAPGERLFSDDVSGESRETGRITSVAPVAPAAGGRPVALGYVRHEHRSPGTWLRLGSATSSRRVEVADLPFYRITSRIEAT